MFLLVVLFVCLRLTIANDIDLLFYDISFRDYIHISRSSNNIFHATLDQFDKKVQFEFKNDSIVSIQTEMSDYNITATHVLEKLGYFINICPDLVQSGYLCTTTAQDMLMNIDLAFELYEFLTEESNEESNEDAYEKIEELKVDFKNVLSNCDERNASAVELYTRVSEYWQFVDENSKKLEKMHAQVKQFEHEMFIESGNHNYTSSVQTQKILHDIYTTVRIVKSFNKIVQFCQESILKYSLINTYNHS